MSYKTPIKPSLSLKGIDERIQQMQTAMDMSWLSQAFGLAERYVTSNNGTPFIFPACSEGNKIDPISMMPSDTYEAFCFWVKEPVAGIESLIEYPNRNPLKTYSISCIFYMDLRRVDTAEVFKVTQCKVREDIYNFFNNVNVDGKLVYTGSVEDDITQIYKDYSIEQIDNVKKAFPRWAIRLNFDLLIRDDCYSLNSYT